MTWQLLPSQGLAEHAAAWDALQQATTNTPFLESLFLQPLLEEFGTGKELLALHWQGETLNAATLVRPVGRGMWETFQPSQLPLGPWVAEAKSPLQPLLHGLMQALPGLALGLGATQLDPKLHPRPAGDAGLRLLDYVATSHVDIAGSFEAYWEARGKNLRQNTRKQLKRLQAEGLEPTLECITQAAGVAEALRDYGALEGTGWKAGTGTAIHPENAQGRFYERMLRNFCEAGRGRIYRYRLGARVVSMDLCIDNGPLVVILKTAYDENCSNLSPSTLMRHNEFQAWWNEGRYQRIEFYGKTMEWHTRWTETERVLYHATDYRWALLRSMQEQVGAFRAQTIRQAAAPAPADR